MANVFDDVSKVRNSVKRNNFDWSHANNLTTDIGRITPISAELLPANSSVKIRPRLGLQFMPMVFPVQTRMKARVSVFKYPLRALWKDYRDYVGNFRSGLVEPYHDFINIGSPQTCGLFDYLGLPTTYVGSFESQNVTSVRFPYKSFTTVSSYTQAYWNSMVGNRFQEVYRTGQNIGAETTYSYASVSSVDSLSNFQSLTISFEVTPPATYEKAIFFCSGNWDILTYLNPAIGSSESSVTISFDSMPPSLISNTRYIVYATSGTYLSKNGEMINPGYSFNDYSIVLNAKESIDGPINISRLNSPYFDSTSSFSGKQLKISAYKARAYEGIYNAYFRDIRNNPFYIGTEVQYNQWLPTMEGGADTTVYELHYANWEKDAYTTAVQSPQQGVAPLVGLTTYTEQIANEDGSVTTKNGVALVDEDGRAFGVDFSSDAEGLNDVTYTELDPNSTTVNQPRSLIDIVNSGISINDLRNVNAYQKYLELNMRAGYSYRNIIQARFNVKVRYDELLMPEFVGGYSRDIDMRSVTQTVMKEDNGMYADSLGSQAGIAGVRESDPPAITVFCDEECIVMTLLTITPMPVYSQVLPKDFLYRELLDHYQPEFNNIGFQPILQSELCPVQAFANDVTHEALNDTFGYQRPWHEYVAKLDTAHGLFRTNMRNFIMNRTYKSAPQLNESFLLVSSDQVNDVFAVTETTDKIYGQIWFDMVAKLPISRKAIPRLD